jgi:serine/threonine-protein kinase HipA
VHIEDFAQILGLYPEQKYAQFNYETLANLVYKLAGESGLDEFIRRLVFVVASGNGDAHLKNWSLIYPDGVNARLSPAYDFVSTIQYQADDQLALNLARSKRWQDVTRESFLRLARKIGEDETRMADRLERQGRHHGGMARLARRPGLHHTGARADFASPCTRAAVLHQRLTPAQSKIATK